MKKMYWICLGLMLLIMPTLSPALALGTSSKYGAGIFFDRSVPIFGFDNRYAASQKFGVVLDRKLSARTTLEFEFHHAKLTDGKIEGQAFTWNIDRKRYLSPEAKSEFKLNSFLLNALVQVGNYASGDMRLLPYVAVGGGFYDYQDTISGLIYPGQSATPLDTDILIEPRHDDHTALGTTVGLGMAVTQGRFGLDIRARYHMIIGDLRSMEAWGLKSVFPISMIDMRTTFKLYF